MIKSRYTISAVSSFVFLVAGLLVVTGIAKAETRTIWVEGYGYVRMTASHYGANGAYDQTGTNNIFRSAQSIVPAAISRGGSYSHRYACGNTDRASVSCLGGNMCSDGDSYRITGSCSRTFVEACTNGCASGSCTPPPAGSPPVPGGFSVTTSTDCGGKIYLSWTESSGATGYKIFRSKSATGTFTQVGTVSSVSGSAAGSPEISYTDNPGTGTYYYRILAYNSVGSSRYTDVKSSVASDICPAPPVPTNLQAKTSVQCGGKVDLSWSPSAGAAGYNVYRWRKDYSAQNNGYYNTYRNYGATYDNWPYAFNHYFAYGLVTPNGTTKTTFTDAPKAAGDFYYSVSAYPPGPDNKTNVSKLVEPAVVGTASELQCNPIPPAKIPPGGTEDDVIGVPIGNVKIKSFRATPNIVNPGDSCNLRWEYNAYNNSSLCTLYGPGGAAIAGHTGFKPEYDAAPINAYSSSPVTTESQFKLVCKQGVNGDEEIKYATCTINPKIQETP